MVVIISSSPHLSLSLSSAASAGGVAVAVELLGEMDSSWAESVIV